MLTIGNTTRTPTNTTGSFTSSSFPLKIETNDVSLQSLYLTESLVLRNRLLFKY